MPNNYDKIAVIYDRLSRFVFGKALINAQVSMLTYVPASSSILVIGGGTGWILEELAALHESGLTITYVELSANMIALSKKRDWKNNKVVFMHQPVENFMPDHSYDIILTPFIFDNFTNEKIAIVFSSLHACLNPHGRWLNADFVYDPGKGKIWQKFLLKLMYTFFRITCNIEARQLVNMENFFKTSNYRPIARFEYYAGFICSAVYERYENDLK